MKPLGIISTVVEIEGGIYLRHYYGDSFEHPYKWYLRDDLNDSWIRQPNCLSLENAYQEYKEKIMKMVSKWT